MLKPQVKDLAVGTADIPLASARSDFDLSRLGHSDRGQIREMVVTITSDPQVGLDERRSQACKALTYMARQFGFLDAAEDTF